MHHHKINGDAATKTVGSHGSVGTPNDSSSFAKVSGNDIELQPRRNSTAESTSSGDMLLPAVTLPVSASFPVSGNGKHPVSGNKLPVSGTFPVSGSYAHSATNETSSNHATSNHKSPTSPIATVPTLPTISSDSGEDDSSGRNSRNSDDEVSNRTAQTTAQSSLNAHALSPIETTTMPNNNGNVVATDNCNSTIDNCNSKSQTNQTHNEQLSSHSSTNQGAGGLLHHSSQHNGLRKGSTVSDTIREEKEGDTKEDDKGVSVFFLFEVRKSQIAK